MNVKKAAAFAGRLRFKLGKFPMIYNEFIIPHKYYREADSNRLLIKVPITIV